MRGFFKNALVWALFLSLSLYGCTRQDMSQQDLELQKMEQASAPETVPPPQQQKTALRIPAEDSGSRNPFSRAGSKLSVSPLLYQSLYVLDDDYIPHEVLAASMVQDNRVCTISLNSSARFSDGSQVMAADVVASLREALKYPRAFPALSRSVESCSVSGDQAVIVLAQEDRNAAALFTFPVCKSGTQSDPLPIGSGAFVLDSPSSTRMRRNPFYRDSARLPEEMDMVELVPVADDESLEYMLKIGVIDFYFSDGDNFDLYGYGSTERLTLNRMTFWGFNRTAGSPLYNDGLAQALWEALDDGQEQLVSLAYGDLAETVSYPFHPGYWKRIQGDALLAQPPTPSPEEAPPGEDGAASSSAPAALPEGAEPSPVPTLEEAVGRLGYTEKDGEGFWVRSSRGNVQRLSLRILVNSENEYRQHLAQLTAEKLAELGIECQISSESYEAYLQAVQARRFDLYLGETRMEANMDISFLFSPENAQRLGLDYDEGLEASAAAFKTGEMDLRGLIEVLDRTAVIKPVCYQKGCFSYSRNLPGNFISENREMFLELQNW